MLPQTAVSRFHLFVFASAVSWPAFGSELFPSSLRQRGQSSRICVFSSRLLLTSRPVCEVGSQATQGKRRLALCLRGRAYSTEATTTLYFPDNVLTYLVIAVLWAGHFRPRIRTSHSVDPQFRLNISVECCLPRVFLSSLGQILLCRLPQPNALRAHDDEANGRHVVLG